MPKEITTNVEALETEAQKILAEANARASEILLRAREDAKRILSSQLPLDEVKIECDKIVNKARAEADKKFKDSEKKAAEISSHADKKTKELTELVVNIVKGIKLA
jgi:cell division septum initiation protein DivIVA